MKKKIKHKKVKHKKVKHKKVKQVNAKRCDVPDCNRSFSVGWKASSTKYKSIGNPYKRVCTYHFNKHIDPDDDFLLHEIFGCLHLGVDCDRFGFPKAPDVEEMAKLSEELAEKEKDITKKKIGVNIKKEVAKKENRRFASPINDAADEILKGFL